MKVSIASIHQEHTVSHLGWVKLLRQPCDARKQRFGVDGPWICREGLSTSEEKTVDISRINDQCRVDVSKSCFCQELNGYRTPKAEVVQAAFVSRRNSAPDEFPRLVPEC